MRGFAEFTANVILLVIGSIRVECQFSQEGNLTVIRPAPPVSRNAGLIAEERNEAVKAPCTTVDDDSDLIRSRNGIIDARYRWRVFNVFIDPSYNERDRATIISAMGQLARAVPCVTFAVYSRDSKPSGDYIHIVNKAGCRSLIGKRGGRQEISLQNPGCVYVGTVMHEMIHALGFTHEQNRPDRDNYVNVLTANIIPGASRNFVRRVISEYSTFGVAYNFQSIMHYGPYDFSRNGRPTITRKNGKTTGIGSVGVLQWTDIQRLRNMYRC